jgi:peptidoglycan hydrolase-like protein with peptidoglycan-binding domain
MINARHIASLVLAGLAVGACTSDDSGGELDIPGHGGPSATASPTAPPPVVATTLPPTTAAPTTTAAPAPTPPPTTTTTTTLAPTTTAPVVTEPPGPFYRAGDEGPEIAVLQLKLETVGFLSPGYTVGVFDSATNSAVLDFQGQYGLIVDGIVGPETERALTAAAVSVNPESG